LQGSTATMANDSGHLRPEFRRSKTNTWGTFIGTWDLPRRLPGLSQSSFILLLVWYDNNKCIKVYSKKIMVSFIKCHMVITSEALGAWPTGLSAYLNVSLNKTEPSL